MVPSSKVQDLQMLSQAKWWTGNSCGVDLPSFLCDPEREEAVQKSNMRIIEQFRFPFACHRWRSAHCCRCSSHQILIKTCLVYSKRATKEIIFIKKLLWSMKTLEIKHSEHSCQSAHCLIYCDLHKKLVLPWLPKPAHSHNGPIEMTKFWIPEVISTLVSTVLIVVNAWVFFVFNPFKYFNVVSCVLTNYFKGLKTVELNLEPMNVIQIFEVTFQDACSTQHWPVGGANV